MKKLDLHIHTIQTVSDHAFSFSMEKLKEYVQSQRIDGIAIVNHNKFDAVQYTKIRNELSSTCHVLPGIEINVGERKFGHLICITENDDIDDFRDRCKMIEDRIQTAKDCITTHELRTIFVQLDKYLWIPHSDKKPVLDPEIILEMKDYIYCGETGSVKKFIYCQKSPESLTPVYFSDLRPTSDLQLFPTRQTFFDIDEISVSSIKKCLSDKTHVSLTEEEGNNLFYVLPDLPISTGLNIVIGERSSGKSYTLDQIAQQYNTEPSDRIKYIRQFSLVEHDSAKAAEQFTNSLAQKKSSFAEEYFELFKDAVETAKNVSIKDDEILIDEYLTNLIRFAKETDRVDMFSKCALYMESPFPERNTENISDLINAVETLLDVQEYRELIHEFIPRESLILLYHKLIQKAVQEKREALEKKWVNRLANSIKRSLSIRSASTSIPDIDFYHLQLNREKVKRFNDLVEEIKKEKIIYKEDLEGFSIQTSKRPYLSASEFRKCSGKKNVSFSDKIPDYNANPYQFLLELKEMDNIPETDYYKYFAYVEYRILNSFGGDISGGERAEFRLLQEIKDAYKYDMLLIDEPESSFDNLFLHEKVNHMIKELALTMPVVLITHNNTIGASIKADYLIHTKRITEGEVRYERYYGLPSSKELVSFSGERIKNYQVVLDCLEAGELAYNERKNKYGLLKD